MEFDNSFEVPLPPAQAWAVLTDVRRIAPCMPGAELTEEVDARTYKGKIAVRLGPVALAFAGTVIFEEMDAAAHRARVKAQGSDAKGRGGANAAATFRLEPLGNGTSAGTKVLVHTELALSGSVAQYGRGVGMIQATAAAIMGQFAKNLRAQLAAGAPATSAAPARAEGFAQTSRAPLAPAQSATEPQAERLEQAALASRLRGNEQPEAATAPTPPVKPISGLSLLASVVWNAIVKLFTGRSQSS